MAMGGFSFWHWMIVFMILAMILPIVMASAANRLTRSDYLYRVLGLPAVGAVAALVDVRLLALVLFGGYFLLGYWSVYRAQDIGWSRWWNVLLLVSPASLVWIFLLLAVPGQSRLSHNE